MKLRVDPLSLVSQGTNITVISCRDPDIFRGIPRDPERDPAQDPGRDLAGSRREIAGMKDMGVHYQTALY